MKKTIVTMFLSLGLLFSSVAMGADKKPVDTQKAKSGETGLIHVATCKDGKEFWAPTDEHRGACSGHGGVASWMDGSPVKAGGKKTAYK